jgi:outer membrane putative beta-barrel porin/alpha-amylase
MLNDLCAVRRGRIWLVGLMTGLCWPMFAQQPFYTDDPGVTDVWQWHLEVFNELDVLQKDLRPNLRQNTLNYKLNMGLPYHLEIDFDNPYLVIMRSLGTQPRRSAGLGDTNLGIKWAFYQGTNDAGGWSFSASMYFEIPTGDTSQELGSGLADYWLNFIAQKRLSKKTRVNGNSGILFSGNTSTGLVGIQTTRGRVATGGLAILHDVNDRLLLGAEVYGGITSNFDLGKSQLQFLLGGKYGFRKGMTFDFGVLGGKYVGSPRAGVQVGFSWDIRGFRRPSIH